MNKLNVQSDYIEGTTYVVQSSCGFYVKRQYEKDADGDELFGIVWTNNPKKAMQFSSKGSAEDCIDEIGDGEVYPLYPDGIKQNNYHIRVTKKCVIEGECDGFSEDEVREKVMKEMKWNHNWDKEDVKIEFL